MSLGEFVFTREHRWLVILSILSNPLSESFCFEYSIQAGISRPSLGKLWLKIDMNMLTELMLISSFMQYANMEIFLRTVWKLARYHTKNKLNLC